MRMIILTFFKVDEVRTIKLSDFLIVFVSLISILLIFLFSAGVKGLILCYRDYSSCPSMDGLDALIKIYDEKLRSDFFSGFLAVGAFLLSLKTFIVMTMKTNVYDTEGYKKNWERMKRIDSRVGDLYQGLRRLNDCLFNSIFASLLAAIAQVTIGLVGGKLFVFFALFLSLVSVFYLIYCLYLVKRNLDAVIPSEV